MSVGFENKEFTLEAKRDKVSGRGNFKDNIVSIVKSGGAWFNVHVMRGNSFRVRGT